MMVEESTDSPATLEKENSEQPETEALEVRVLTLNIW